MAESSQDRFRGMDTGNFDPHKDDFLHGRCGPGLWGGRFSSVDPRCCMACIFGEGRYPHSQACKTHVEASK